MGGSPVIRMIHGWSLVHGAPEHILVAAGIGQAAYEAENDDENREEGMVEQQGEVVEDDGLAGGESVSPIFSFFHLRRKSSLDARPAGLQRTPFVGRKWPCHRRRARTQTQDEGCHKNI